MKTKLCTLILALTASVGITRSEVYSGSCGENSTWSLNTADSTLTFTGVGAMTDWNDKYSTPWYKYQSYIKYVSLSDDLTHIGGSAFSDCSSLTSITIGKKLASIGKDAFSNCSNLTAVHISDLVAWCNIEYDKSWGSTGSIPLIYAHNLYLNGELVTELVIPDEVTSLNASAFHGCTNLTSVVIPQHVTSIGSSAFYGCNKLSSITIGKNVTSIGLYVFYGCTNLHSVIWNAKNCESPTKYENALFYNIFNQITSLTFGEEVETIPNYLAYKTNITSIELPNSVTSIGNYAFYDCGSATSIIIPKNLTSIGENV